ncbi:helix-hairpin-helix domain-containing protein [candidate division KSB1 bacterium]|nr:helix-hairpin-helix domain-containing protein [candidate division KSB1 bacterium]
MNILLSKIFLSLMFVALCSAAVIAQETEIENILEGNEEYSDVSYLMELLTELENKPLDLNAATAKQLSLLPWISDVLAHEIVEYRLRFGDYNSIQELEKFSQIDKEILPLLNKYLTVSYQIIPRDFSLNLKMRASRKLQQSEGFKTGYYYPSPEKIYNRLICHYGEDIKFGILLEKDSGEKQLNDLTSYFIKYSNADKNYELIFGNYFLETGQGLIFSNPYGARKSSNPIYAAKRKSRNAREYTLVDENASLFGMSGKIDFSVLQLLLFYSSNKIDASFNVENGNVTNFYTSGYHRNENEINKKDQLTEQLAGLRLEFKPRSNILFGMTGYQSRFNSSFFNDNLIRNRFAFQGKINSLVGCDYNLTLGFFNLFGEFALSRNRGFAVLSGILLDSKDVKLTLSFRNYGKDFISLHGNSFGENSGNPMNERGFYFGLKINPLKNLKLSFYFDTFKFPWRTYLIPMPQNGKELFAAIKYKPMKRLWLYFQLRAKQKNNLVTQYDQTNLEKKIIIPRDQLKTRFQIEYQPHKKIKLRHRIEKNWTYYKKNKGEQIDKKNLYSGILFYQDIQYKFYSKVGISYRIVFFDTDGYEARLYEFERDVPGILTNQMLYGKGSRWYLFAKWKINSFISLSLKYSSTHYYFTNHIGSQADQISGDQVNAINFLVETKL